MKTIDVFRLEHSEQGIGPIHVDYTLFSPKYKKVIDELVDYHECWMPVPSIFEDILDVDGDIRRDTVDGNDIFSACLTIDQINELFGKWMNDLKQIGFKVYKLTLLNGKYTIGRSQKQVGYLADAVIKRVEV